MDSERLDVMIYTGDDVYRVHYCMGAYQVFQRVRHENTEFWEWLGSLDEIMQQLGIIE